jgi:Type I phosphodiesterase / nucleotide pyrophosphatase
MSDLDRLLHSYAQGAISRQTFLHRLLTLGVSLTFAETLLNINTKHVLAAPQRQAVPSRPPYFVMVVMDAFRADYLEYVPMPNLEWLMSRGTTFPQAWVGQLESYTPASHATLSTGATPAHQGVIGFEWRDPATGQEAYTAWYNDVIAGRLEAQLLQHGVDSIPQAIKRQDPNARVVALSSEKYYAADAMGGPAADYILYGLPQGSTITAKGIPHHVPPDAFMQRPTLSHPWPMRLGQFDELSMTMALESLRFLDPRALLINLPGPDIYGHRVGGPARQHVMSMIIKGCDDQLGRLIAAYRDRGILEQTIFVVTGDHGMVRNIHQIDENLLKQTIGAKGEYLFHTGGNCAFIWVKDPKTAPGVAQHLVDTMAHCPFAHYQTIESGAYAYHPVVSAGSTLDPALEAALQYLLGTFAGPLAPDITLAFEENTITRWYPDSHGEHGGATWGAQQIPLIIAGPGVRVNRRSPFPARLMDVAPTVLALLGIQSGLMDGVALADALQTPTTQQQRQQDLIASSLLNFQRAVIARSNADIALQNPPFVRGPKPPPGNPE